MTIDVNIQFLKHPHTFLPYFGANCHQTDRCLSKVYRPVSGLPDCGSITNHRRGTIYMSAPRTPVV